MERAAGRSLYGTAGDVFWEDCQKARSVRSFSERYPQVRVTRCEHHYVFYGQPEGQKSLIIAVLHERMDVVARLYDRLEGLA